MAIKADLMAGITLEHFLCGVIDTRKNVPVLTRGVPPGSERASARSVEETLTRRARRAVRGGEHRVAGLRWAGSLRACKRGFSGLGPGRAREGFFLYFFFDRKLFSFSILVKTT